MKNLLLSATVLSALAIGSAQAAPFGPATTGISLLFSPTVTTVAPTGSVTLTGALFATSPTGTLAGPPAITSGTGAGTVNFSTTVGTTIADVISSLFSFSDGLGGAYTFDLASVTTSILAIIPAVSTSISLYLLGTMGDAFLGLTPTPTSVTLTLNKTGSSAFSGSATLANPPAPPPPPIPEPATLALLGVGLLGLGLVRRVF